MALSLSLSPRASVTNPDPRAQRQGRREPVGNACRRSRSKTNVWPLAKILPVTKRRVPEGRGREEGAPFGRTQATRVQTCVSVLYNFNTARDNDSRARR